MHCAFVMVFEIPLRYNQKTPPKACRYAGGRLRFSLSLQTLSLPCLAPCAVARTQPPFIFSAIASKITGRFPSLAAGACPFFFPFSLHSFHYRSIHFGRKST